MTAIELKSRLIEKINAITDEALLNDLRGLAEESILHLSDAHKTAVNTAIQQIQNGEYITHEHAKKETEIWLNR